MGNLAQNGPKWGNPGESGRFHAWRHGKTPGFALDVVYSGRDLKYGADGHQPPGLEGPSRGAAPPLTA